MRLRLDLLRFDKLDAADGDRWTKGFWHLSYAPALAVVLGMMLTGTAPIAAQYKVKG